VVLELEFRGSHLLDPTTLPLDSCAQLFLVLVFR
jgi:hypothetical protein